MNGCAVLIEVGLFICITDSFCQTLSAIEYCIRCHSTTNEFDKKEIHDSILDDSDVLFNWCSAAGMLDEDKKGVILSLIVAKYVTIRGFSFTKSVMETYKQVSKKSTSKSKPLRKKVAIYLNSLYIPHSLIIMQSIIFYVQ